MSDCQEWTGAKFSFGYGMVWHNGGPVRVHRLAWERAHGPIPAGLLVLHRCDNPPCYNVDHLFLGTHADNRADCAAKGRIVCTNRKLAPECLPEILDMLDQGVPCSEIARQFGINRSSISRIKSGKLYRSTLHGIAARRKAAAPAAPSFAGVAG